MVYVDYLANPITNWGEHDENEDCLSNQFDSLKVTDNVSYASVVAPAVIPPTPYSSDSEEEQEEKVPFYTNDNPYRFKRELVSYIEDDKSTLVDLYLNTYQEGSSLLDWFNNLDYIKALRFRATDELAVKLIISDFYTEMLYNSITYFNPNNNDMLNREQFIEFWVQPFKMDEREKQVYQTVLDSLNEVRGLHPVNRVVASRAAIREVKRVDVTKDERCEPYWSTPAIRFYNERLDILRNAKIIKNVILEESRAILENAIHYNRSVTTFENARKTYQHALFTLLNKLK